MAYDDFGDDGSDGEGDWDEAGPMVSFVGRLFRNKCLLTSLPQQAAPAPAPAPVVAPPPTNPDEVVARSYARDSYKLTDAE